MVSAASSQVQAKRNESAKLGAGVLALGAASALLLAGQAAARRRTNFDRSIRERAGNAAGEIGRGILAGASGTLAITTASTIDQLVTEAAHARKESRAAHLELGKAITSPWLFSAEVASKVLGISFSDADHERRVSLLAHWGYGSSWGLALAALRASGIRGVGAAGAVLGGQLAAEMAVMPAFGLFSPPTQWGRRALVSSVYQHLIYALAAVAAFEWLHDRPCR